MKKRRWIVLTILLTSGCGLLQTFWDKEFVGVYAPNTLRERQKNDLAEVLNHWLGQLKSERIRIVGPPAECVPLSSAEERCEWRSPWVTSSDESASVPSSTASPEGQRISFVYDRSGLARSWSYSGPYGQFTNSDYHLTKAQRVSPKEPSSQQPLEWIHATKAKEEFLSDYYQCQNNTLQDPQGQKGARGFLQEEIERCLKQRGWGQNLKR